VGELLGEENKGMRAMFLMMNEARLLVGMQGFLCQCLLHECDKLCQRTVQGKNLLQMMDPNASSVPIIQHPDVRRMLITMKSYVEGMRSLLYYAGYLSATRSPSSDDEGKKPPAGHHGPAHSHLQGICHGQGF
jgi:alkylation response protein AidB-like acyl-CoA dehydrogenase